MKMGTNSFGVHIVKPLLGGHSNKNNIWLSGFAIAFVIVCDLNPFVRNFLSVTGENS